MTVPRGRASEVAEGKYVTFEGMGGSGKSTQVSRVKEWFEARGQPAVFIKEPGTHDFGERIRELVLGREDLDSLTEALLFEADRSYSFAQVVLPALERGLWVISDRGPDGTEVFQGILGSVQLDLIEAITSATTRGKVPDRTILLQVSPTIAFERSQRRGVTNDKFDERGLKFFERLYDAYKELATRHAERIVVVDGSRAVDQITRDVIAIIEGMVE